MRTLVPFVVAFTVVLGAGAAFAAEHAGPISETQKAGSYSVTLKVLPAESFEGPNAEMAWDAGERPVTKASAEQPNHHLVAFVEKDGKAAEKAEVTIRYRMDSQTAWKSLPVARMHVRGKGLETTHYGNNVRLAPGKYTAEVSVDGGAPATFHFTLPAEK